MGFELWRGRIRPLCDVEDHSGVGDVRRRHFERASGGLHDAEAVAIEKIGMIAEQPIELRDQRMVFRQGFSLQLSFGSRALCGIELHCSSLYFGGLPISLCSGRISASRGTFVTDRGTFVMDHRRACHLKVIETLARG